MSKRAQVTIFIIIGLILIVGAAVTFYVTKLVTIEEAEVIAKVPTEVQPIYDYIDNCIKISVLPAVKLMGSQGGYVSLPEDYFSFEDGDTAYLFDKGESKVPTITEMEAQLSLYLSNALPECTKEFESFKEQGFEITAAEIVVYPKINPNNIVFDVTYPLNIKKGEFSTQFDRFRYVSELPLGYMHNAANQLVEKLVEDSQYVDMTYLETFDLDITVIPATTESFLYSIKEGEFLFLFANRFVVNTPPEIEGADEEVFRIKDNEPFSYNVTVADDGPVTLEDDTAMFDITQNGLIEFTPDITGTFEVTITATDEQGETATKKLRFIIEE